VDIFSRAYKDIPHLMYFGSPTVEICWTLNSRRMSFSVTFESSNVTVVVCEIGLASTALTPGIFPTISLIVVDEPLHTQPGVLISTVLSAAHAAWLPANHASSAAITKSRNKLFLFMRASCPVLYRNNSHLLPEVQKKLFPSPPGKASRPLSVLSHKRAVHSPRCTVHR
jgi:hypothetical protein